MNWTFRLRIAVAIALVGATGQAALARNPQDAVAPAPALAADPIAVQATINALQNAIAQLSPNATPQDAEAAIAFALDQQRQPAVVSYAALNFLIYQADQGRKIRVALIGARQAVRKRATGTAGLADENGATLIAGPSVTGGSGVATYTP